MAATAGRSAESGSARRLAWLDALRGFAALVVVFEHSLDALFPEVRAAVSPKFDIGKYGVFVFFLVSGYVVPASLERGGSVRAFWIGRFFRIYPLWAVAALIGTGFGLAQVFWALPGPLTDHPWISALAHLTMLQDLLGAPNVLNVFWTLSYEMAFYLLLTAMYTAGVRRSGAGTALGLAVAALALGLILPLISMGIVAADLRTAVGWESTVLAAGVLAGLGLAAALADRRWARRCGAALLAVTVLALLIGNSRLGGWQSLIILATMFAGTAVHRLERAWQNGRTTTGTRPGGGRPALWWAQVAAVGLVPVLSIAAAVVLYPRTGHPRAGTGLGAEQWGWCTAIAAAWATFALGLTMRHRRLPQVLPWLGVISYSVYLLHQLPLQVLRRLLGDPAARSLLERSVWAVILLTAVLAVSALTHRFVERPMQDLGRRLARRQAGPAAAPTAAAGVPAVWSAPAVATVSAAPGEPDRNGARTGTSAPRGIVLSLVGSGSVNMARK